MCEYGSNWASIDYRLALALIGDVGDNQSQPMHLPSLDSRAIPDA
jgi:hypothetical protein